MPKQKQVPPKESVSTLLAATLIHEAGGEKDVNAMLAVGAVIHNRHVKTRKPYREIILAPKQFSCFNGMSVHRAISLAREHNAWPRAKALADQILSGMYKDPTKGATHYYNPKKCDPSWASSLAETVRIGNHRFLK